ncbi:MAG: glyoxalase [Lachnospiraceae bacterium]|nr:glyoxalase [Lachnospiraceae bacterium]MBR2403128.1 glyoxalase [Lachnospiraceae bacterium]
MNGFDRKVLKCFLDQQLKLFPEEVAANEEEAEEFLEDCMAVVLDSKEDVLEYLEEVGVDLEEQSEEEILSMEEVFAVGDGRYLVVEC